MFYSRCVRITLATNKKQLKSQPPIIEKPRRVIQKSKRTLIELAPSMGGDIKLATGCGWRGILWGANYGTIYRHEKTCREQYSRQVHKQTLLNKIVDYFTYPWSWGTDTVTVAMVLLPQASVTS